MLNLDALMVASNKASCFCIAILDGFRRTEVICEMKWRQRPEGEGGAIPATERTVRFRVEADGAFPLTRMKGETEVPETTASAARYLLETFRT